MPGNKSIFAFYYSLLPLGWVLTSIVCDCDRVPVDHGNNDLRYSLCYSLWCWWTPLVLIWGLSYFLSTPFSLHLLSLGWNHASLMTSVCMTPAHPPRHVHTNKSGGRNPAAYLMVSLDRWRPPRLFPILHFPIPFVWPCKSQSYSCFLLSL